MQQDDRWAGSGPLVANRRPVGRVHLAHRRPCSAGAGLTVHGPDPRPGPGPALSSVVIPPATIRHPVTGRPDGSMTRIRLQNHTLAGETQGQPLTYAMPEHGPSQERPPGGRSARSRGESADAYICGSPCHSRRGPSRRHTAAALTDRPPFRLPGERRGLPGEPRGGFDGGGEVVAVVIGVVLRYVLSVVALDPVGTPGR